MANPGYTYYLQIFHITSSFEQAYRQSHQPRYIYYYRKKKTEWKPSIVLLLTTTGLID